MITPKDKRIDHIESVCEELVLNGYDCKIVEKKIQYDSISGTMIYDCCEKTIMGDFYRFISHLGSKLHYYGLEQKIKEHRI